MCHWNQKACVAVRRDCVSQLQQQYRLTQFGHCRGISVFTRNSVKFCGNTEIPRLGSKFCGLQETMGPNHNPNPNLTLLSPKRLSAQNVCIRSYSWTPNGAFFMCCWQHLYIHIHRESKIPGPLRYSGKASSKKAQMLVIFDRDNCNSSVHMHLQVTSLMLLKTTCSFHGNNSRYVRAQWVDFEKAIVDKAIDQWRNNFGSVIGCSPLRAD